MILGIAGVAFGVALLWGLAYLTSRGDVDPQLGDDLFEAGRTDSLADAIERNGPIPFSDVAGGNRDIFVQHLGPTDDDGWLAFSAQPPGAGRECSLSFLMVDEEFDDPCSGRRYPSDGEGLTQYPTTVTDARLQVDLRQDQAP